MMALSLKPWWLWNVLHGGQHILARNWSWTPDYRGPLLLVASAGAGGRPTRERERSEAVRLLARMHRGGAPPEMPALDALPRSAILGRARMAGVLRTDDDFAAYAATTAGGAAQRPWWREQLGLVLADVEILPAPVPFTQACLYLFDIPEAVLGLSPAVAAE